MPFFSFPLTGVFVVIAAMVLTHFAVLFTFSGFKLKVSPKPSFIWTFEPAKLWHLDWFSCVLQLSFFLVHTIFVVERISVTRNPVLLTLCYLVLFSASPQFFTVLNFVFKLVSFKLFQKPFPTTCFLQHFLYSCLIDRRALDGLSCQPIQLVALLHREELILPWGVRGWSDHTATIIEIFRIIGCVSFWSVKKDKANYFGVMEITKLLDSPFQYAA